MPSACPDSGRRIEADEFRDGFCLSLRDCLLRFSRQEPKTSRRRLQAATPVTEQRSAPALTSSTEISCARRCAWEWARGALQFQRGVPVEGKRGPTKRPTGLPRCFRTLVPAGQPSGLTEPPTNNQQPATPVSRTCFHFKQMPFRLFRMASLAARISNLTQENRKKTLSVRLLP